MARELILEKLDQTAALLEEHRLDCWITFVRETGIMADPMLPFLTTGSLTWHSAFLISRSGRRLAVVGDLDRRTVEDLGVYDRVTGYTQGIQNALAEALRELAPETVALNFSKDSEIADGLTHGMFLSLSDILRNSGFSGRIVSSEPVVSKLRARKSPFELSRIQMAIAKTQDIFERVRSMLRPGLSEREIARFVLEEASRLGFEPAWDRAHCPAVFTGPDSAEAHYQPTERTVEPGHLVNMDFGLRIEGYCSDLQRTFYVPEAPESTIPDSVARGFQTIVDAIERARLTMRPGVRGDEVDASAREFICSKGYESFPHALGHQVGRFVHDGTALLGPEWEKYGSKPKLPLEEGMVFTLEPRLKVPGRGVATIEEMVVVGETGATFLSNPQKSLWMPDFP